MHPQLQGRQRLARRCAGKHRFAFELQALAHASWRSVRGVWLRAYGCDHCGGWHLTKQEPLTTTGEAT